MGVNSKPLVDGVEKARASIGGLKQSFANVGEFAKVGEALKVLGVSFAAFKGVEGVGEAFKGVFESGKELQAQSRSTGESITTLVALKKAYQEVGMDAGSLSGNLTMLRASLGGVNAEGEPTKAIFDQLGLSIDKLKGQNAVDQFKAIGESLSHLATQEDKVAAVRAIFGRAGGDMLNILGDPGAIDEAAKTTAGKAAILQKNAASFTKLTNEFEAIGNKVSGFFLGASEGVAGAIEPILGMVKQINTIRLGEKAGEFVKTITGAFQQGKVGELLGDSMMVAGMQLTNILGGAAVGFGKGILAYLQNIPDLITNYVGLLKDGLVGAVEVMGAMLLNTFEKPIHAFQAGLQWGIEQAMGGLSKVPGLNKLLGVEGFTPSSFQSIMGNTEKETPKLFGQDAGELAASALTNFNAAAEKAKGISKTLMDKIVPAVMEGFTQGKIYDQSTIQEAKDKLSKTGAGILSGAMKSAGESDGKAPFSNFSLAGVNVKGDSTSPHGGKEQASDRLAKIGGFIGGGGAQAEHARRTADATQALLTIMKAVQQSGLKTVSQMMDQGGSDVFAFSH